MAAPSWTGSRVACIFPFKEFPATVGCLCDCVRLNPDFPIFTLFFLINQHKVEFIYIMQ